MANRIPGREQSMVAIAYAIKMVLVDKKYGYEIIRNMNIRWHLNDSTNVAKLVVVLLENKLVFNYCPHTDIHDAAKRVASWALMVYVPNA